MLVEITLGRDLNPMLYSSFSKYVFTEIKRDIKKAVRKYYKKYKVRESLILESPLIRWKSRPPKKINFDYYLNNCLELRKIKGTYYIKLNEKLIMYGTRTKVSTLIRILEYGTTKISQLPILRKIFLDYQLNLESVFKEFIKSRRFLPV